MTDDDMHHDDDLHRAQRDMQRALAGMRAPDALRRSVEDAVAAAPRSRLGGAGPARRATGRAGGRRRSAPRPRIAAALGGAAAVL
ncbi:MAG TPA: hypothetical protein VK506_09185, partial [Conexibacter sp.]|nr:hypothetical protein [Conexibacter sp.]